MLQNLLMETRDFLERHKKKSIQVRFVQTSQGSMDWATFEKLAANADYDSGFSGPEIAEDLVVVGYDWWMERHEYEGAEWWEFKTLPSERSRLVDPKLKNLLRYG